MTADELLFYNIKSLASLVPNSIFQSIQVLCTKVTV
jgi:hypothetical protein